MSNSSQQSPAFPPADLATLAPLVEFEKCALVLGPLASCDAEGRPLRRLLAAEIAAEVSKKTGQRLPDDGDLSLACTAFMKIENLSRTSLEMLVRDFYKRHTEPSALLKAAARLPFRLIFTASHDELLQKAFLQERKRQFRSGFYRFSKTQIDDYDDTPPDQTYIYQLFGRTSEKLDGSLVLTIADQLAFIDSIQGPGKETHLPAGLRRAMQECEAMLFVGFDYENWYLKVLFHILRFSEKSRLIFGLPEGKSAEMNPVTVAFFSSQYKFSFLADQPLELFEELRARIEAGAPESTPDDTSARTLLWLYAGEEKDMEILARIDKQLASAKRTYNLRAVNIHDFDEAGDAAAIMDRRVEEASVIVALLSADFGADETLLKLTEKALSRQSPSVVVAGVYGRTVSGLTDLFKNKAPVFPAETVPLDLMQEDVGAKMVADMLEKLIQTLPNP